MTMISMLVMMEMVIVMLKVMVTMMVMMIVMMMLNDLPTGRKQSTSATTVHAVHICPVQQQNLTNHHSSSHHHHHHSSPPPHHHHSPHPLHQVLHLDNISVSLPGSNMKSGSAVGVFQLCIGTCV